MVKLRYGKSYTNISFDKEIMYKILDPADIEGVKNSLFEVQTALHNPIESPTLGQLAKGKHRVVILASDITRPSPSSVLIPPIINELIDSGVNYNEIKIIFSLGYHRKHTENEKRKLVGQDIYNKIECIDHDINNCVYIGTTKKGTPVDVFRKVAESDLLIATGNLEFHYKAGYSGGLKALLPGVCSKRTIETNHIMMVKPGTMPGKTDRNPMREDIEDAGLIAGVDFIVNAVLNSRNEIVKVVAGHPIEAHREGIKYIDKMYKRDIYERADIVIASCGGFPKDINLYQAQKGLENASYAVKNGGSIILCAECRDGIGDDTFKSWMIRAKTPHDCIDWIQHRFKLGAHKAAVICMILEKSKVYLVSNLNDKLLKDMFFIPVKSAQEALDATLNEYGKNAKIIVLPYANSTLPFIKENCNI